MNKKKKINRKIIYTIFFVFLILAVVFYVFYNKSNKNLKIETKETIYEKEANKKYFKEKTNFVGNSEELEIVSNYLFINLFTIKDKNNYDKEKFLDLIDSKFIDLFDKQVKQNLFSQLDLFRTKYGTDNLPVVKKINIKKIEKDFININNKNYNKYNFITEFEYEINSFNKNNELLSTRAIENWPYKLNCSFYWDKESKKWKLSKINKIITNKEEKKSENE